MSITLLEELRHMEAEFGPLLTSPALGECAVAGTVEQVRINPHAEAFTHEGRLRDYKDPRDPNKNPYRAPAVCDTFNSIDPYLQHEAATRLLANVPIPNGRLGTARDAVVNITGAILSTGEDHVTTAFEDGWREEGWRALWESKLYWEAREAVKQAPDAESRQQAEERRVLTLIQVVSGLSIGLTPEQR